MDSETKFSPPYNIPWATFLSAVERISADPPGRIDRTYLDSQSGTVQTYLIAALKGFGLIDDDARPTRVMEFADPDKRPERMADLIREFYPTVVPLGESSTTPGQLNEAFAEAFPSITGESRVKALRFFLAAMTYANLPRSSLWGSVKAPRGASARKAGVKRTRSGANGGGAVPDAAPKPAHVSGETVSVDLGQAGRVVVTVDVKWLQLDEETFIALRRAINDLKVLAAAAGGGPADNSTEEDSS